MQDLAVITINRLSALRPLLFLLLAIALNLCIFILIQQMVNQKQMGISDHAHFDRVDFTRIKYTPKPPAPEQKKEPPAPPQQEPPPVPKQIRPTQPEAIDIKGPELQIKLPPTMHGQSLPGPILKADRSSISNQPTQHIYIDITPSIKVNPVYPMRALRRGIEGVVTVEFTIAVDGTVQNPKIVAADPPKIFNSAVLNSIKKWRFDPDPSGGEPTERRARQRIKFKLQD